MRAFPMSAAMSKVGRNDPSPCGSGKKFKQCHGAPGAAAVPPKPDVMQLLRTGMALQQAGSLDAAERNYRQVLDAEPNHADALHLLGLLLHQRGEHAQGAALIERAIRLRPDVAAFRLNCGEAYRAAGQIPKAIACYDAAIKLQPDFAEAWVNRGVALREAGDLPAAVASQRQALRLRPAFREAHLNLGIALRQLGSAEEAIDALRSALALQGDDPATLNDLGVLLLENGEVDASRSVLERALELAPDNAGIAVSLGMTFETERKLNRAVPYFRRAVSLRPDYVKAWENLGVTLHRMGDRHEAVDAYEAGIALDPENAELHFSLALASFANGDVARGWREYAWRFHRTVNAPALRPFSQPSWQGESLVGKTLLVWGEQGIGSEIWFSGVFPDLQKLIGPGRLLVECTPKFAPLLRLSFPWATIVARTDPPQPMTQSGIDFQVAGGDIGKYLRPDLASFPKRDRYLLADAEREAHWRRTFSAGGPGLRVGVCWRSSNMSGGRAELCTQIAQWQEIFKVRGVRFINLQYDECSAELDAAEKAFGVCIERYPGVDMFDDLAETAALMRGLDLVVTAPTLVSVLAAALGVPTWQMIYIEDWQEFGAGRTPWYPSMQTYVRKWDEDWEPVLSRVAGDLARKAAK